MQVPIQSESGLFVCGGKIAIRLTSFAFWRIIKSATNLILFSETLITLVTGAFLRILFR